MTKADIIMEKIAISKQLVDKAIGTRIHSLKVIGEGANFSKLYNRTRGQLNNMSKLVQNRAGVVSSKSGGKAISIAADAATTAKALRAHLKDEARNFPASRKHGYLPKFN